MECGMWNVECWTWNVERGMLNVKWSVGWGTIECGHAGVLYAHRSHWGTQMPCGLLANNTDRAIGAANRHSFAGSGWSITWSVKCGMRNGPCGTFFAHRSHWGTQMPAGCLPIIGAADEHGFFAGGVQLICGDRWDLWETTTAPPYPIARRSV